MPLIASGKQPERKVYPWYINKDGRYLRGNKAMAKNATKHELKPSMTGPGQSRVPDNEAFIDPPEPPVAKTAKKEKAKRGTPVVADAPTAPETPDAPDSPDATIE